MADRVFASITRGGTISPAAYTELADISATEGLSTEWDGDPFETDQRTEGEPLQLFAHEVAWVGSRNSKPGASSTACRSPAGPGAYGGQWGAERVVFTGEGEATSYAADEEGRIMIDQDTAERLGSIEVIRAHFAAADFVVPPLIVAIGPS